MMFPTGGELGSFTRMLQSQQLAARIAALRPDLQQRIATDGPDSVRLLLPERPNGHRPSIVLALLRAVRSGPCWLVAAPGWTPGGDQVWHLDTDQETLARATVAMYDAAEHEQRPASPWRWAEPSLTGIVRVADDLLARGLDVEAVVDSNRVVPDAVEGFELRRRVPPGIGPALRIRLGQTTATVACKPTLGWVLDRGVGTDVRRLDLAAAVTGEPSMSPGFHTEDCGDVARAVADTLSRGPVGERSGLFREAGGDSPERPLQHAAAEWLRDLGYPDARADDAVPAVHTHAAHVALSVRRNAAGLGEVKAAYADAALAGRPLFMFSQVGYTGPAQQWADRARAALFSLPPGGDRLGTASDLAREHLPTLI